MANCNYDWSDVEQPITRENLIGWIKTLRSGEYQQAKGALRKYDEETFAGGYCCLGVYAHTNNTLKYGYFEPEGFKPSSSSSLNAWNEAYGSYSFYMPDALQEYLMIHNDGGYCVSSKSFYEISCILERMFGI
jgi:hypothetical protein